MKPEKALEMALDAHALGKQELAAKKHGVSQPTVSRAIAQVASDPVLNADAWVKKKELAEALQLDRLEFLKTSIAEMKVKVPSSELRDIAGAYKIVSDHHETALRVIADASTLGDHRPEREGDKQDPREGQPTASGPAQWLAPVQAGHTQ